MTANIMVEGNWGERRVAERTRRRYRRGRWMAGGLIAFGLGVPFLSGFIDGFLHRPHQQQAASWEAPVMVIGFLAVALTLGALNWRELDEVERRQAVNVWATIGFVSFLLHPVLEFGQPFLHLADPAKAGWLLPLVAGAAVMLYQRVRR